MNLNRNVFLISVAILTMSSCNINIKQETNLTPEYSYRCIKKDWNISDYFELNKVTCLETNRNCFISKIDKLLIKNDRIYILDQEAKSVFMFSYEGKFLSKINKIGKGPGEYLSIESMDVEDDKIYLLAWQAKQKIMKFDWELSFISEEVSPITCGAMKVVKDGTYYYPANSCNKKLLKNSMHHNFAFLNRKGKVLWYDLPYNDSYCGRVNTYGSRGCNFSTTSSKDVLFTKPFSDNIYKAEKDGLKPYIKLDFGYRSIENSQNKMDRIELLKHYKEKGLFKSIGNLCVSQCFTYFQIFSNKSFRCIVEGKNAYFTSCSGVDPKVGLNLSSQIGGTSDYEGMIVEVGAEHIKYMCENKPDMVADPIKEIDKTLTRNDNPVLLFLKYKE